MDVETHAPLHTGSMLDGRYELRRVLGQGSEGTVFEAVHRFTGQRHAVKIANVQVSDGDDWKHVRLLREARALGQIRHPNIVSITDAGVAEGFPFVAMELLHGRSLESLLVTRSRFTVSDAIGAALQICGALGAAHAVGVLHRDVKPGNMIVVREGDFERVKLVDFGSSKPTDPGAEKVTAAGALVGTPAYMAPEQLLAQDVDERVDVYAVGVLLFECLTGTVPYEGAYPRVLMAACTPHAPPSVRLIRPQIDSTLERVIAKALAKKREDRYATVAALAEALRAACPQVDGLTRLLEDALPANAQPRRKFNRAPYRTPVRIRTSHGDVDGHCEDISEGGMLLLTSAPCVAREEVSVRFALPIEGRIAVCKARVQWARARTDRPNTTQAIGIEILEMSPDIRASVARYVALMTGTIDEPLEVMDDSRRVPTRSGVTAKETMPGTPSSIRRVMEKM